MNPPRARRGAGPGGIETQAANADGTRSPQGTRARGGGRGEKIPPAIGRVRHGDRVFALDAGPRSGG